MRKILLLLMMLLCNFGVAGDCKSLSKEEAYVLADFVFLGYVFEVTDSSYRIKILEFFKGVNGDTLQGKISKNTSRPQIGSTWLIYASELNEREFLADACSGSKCLNWPYGIADVTFPTPIPFEISNNPAALFLYKQLANDKALNEFYYDISSLRARRNGGSLGQIKSEQILMGNKFSQLTTELKLIEIVLSVLVVSVISFGFIIGKGYLKSKTSPKIQN